MTPIPTRQRAGQRPSPVSLYQSPRGLIYSDTELTLSGGWEQWDRLWGPGASSRLPLDLPTSPLTHNPLAGTSGDLQGRRVQTCKKAGKLLPEHVPCHLGRAEWCPVPFVHLMLPDHPWRTATVQGTGPLPSLPSHSRDSKSFETPFLSLAGCPHPKL